jgi:16S rRNA (uracil1498-N3)-methyltransferase
LTRDAWKYGSATLGNMTRRRWIADDFSSDRAAITGSHADHLIRVLRARVGQEFEIATGTVVRQGRVVTIDIDEKRVEFELGEEVPASQGINLTLVLAILKFDRMEWAIEKCTELGVSRIIPVVARRTEKHLAAASVKRVERWRRIAMQAAEQSRRASPPETEQKTLLRDVLCAYSEGEIVLAIGPEGGWAEEELGFFQKAGWTSASLGPRILRAETAAIAASAITISELAE